MTHEGASFERKLFAWLVDKAISLLFLALYIFLFVRFASQDISIILYVVISIGLAYFTYILLYAIFLKGSGSSIGMLIFRIKAIHFSETRILLREALIRAILSGLIPFAIANAIYMLAAHTERSAVDQLTETYIVRR